MRKLILPAFALALMVAASPASAQEAFEGTMTVVDLTCKVQMDLSGDDHRMCAEVCADMGLPLGFMDEEGNVYLPAEAAMPSPPQNERLKPHAEQKVQVKGQIVERGGMKMLVIESVTAEN